MTKRLLEIYLTVCEKESMSAAAKELNMSQPAVSGAVGQLEKNYETRLFERHGKTIELTESGRRLRQYAETILSQYEQAWQALHEEEKISSYKTGITSSAADTMLARFAGELKEKTCWITGEADALVQMLKEHRIDLCIADLNADETGLTYIPLYKEELCAAASSSYCDEDDIGISRLMDMRLLLREKGSGSRTALEAAVSRRSLELTPWLESGSDLTLIRMAENGLGLTVVPKRLIEKSLKKKRLHTIRIKGADFRRQYYLIYRSDMYMDKELTELIGTIRTAAKKGNE